jgi:hypothetical protein
MCPKFVGSTKNKANVVVIKSNIVGNNSIFGRNNPAHSFGNDTQDIDEDKKYGQMIISLSTKSKGKTSKEENKETSALLIVNVCNL